MKEKIKFINRELFALIKKVNPDVRQLIYFLDQHIGRELCHVVFKSGTIIKVDITADSFSAITKDVLRAVD